MNYIAIEREYGSGGRSIARALGQACGLPSYGREILEQAAVRLHIPVSQLEQYEEKATNSFFYSLALIGKTQAADPDLLMKDGRLFVAEQMAIRELASRGPAIFVGHCAAEALKENGSVLRVFIKSSREARRKRITEEYGIPENEVDATIRRFDKKRAGYYMANTAQKWRDPNNYDLILDSSALGIRDCVSALRALVQPEG